MEAKNPSQNVKLEDRQCVSCQNSTTKKLFDAESTLSVKSMHFGLVQCMKCGLVYTNPRPTAETIGDFYPKSYGPHQSRTQTSLGERLKLWLEKKTYECRLGFPSNNPTSPLKLYFTQIFTQIFGQYYPFVPYLQNGRLLEVGTGSGRLLELLNGYGWQTYGTELGKDAAEYAQNKRNLNVKHGTIFDAKYEDNFFDCIYYHHVFEHVYDPFKELKELKRILKPNGYLYIAVPNIASFEAKLFQQYWIALDPPVHLYHFSQKTLYHFLKSAGFTPHSFRTYSPEYNLYHSLKKYLQHVLPNSENSETGALFCKCLTLLLIPPYLFLDFLGKGSCLRVLVQNNGQVEKS